MKRVRVPIPCDFCGQVETKAGRLNYSDVCDTCRRPRKAKTVLIAVPARSVRHVTRRAA